MATKDVRNIVLSCLRFGDFTLSSGQKSTSYFRLEHIFADYKSLTTITLSMRNKVNLEGFKEVLLAGPAMGAIPLICQGSVFGFPDQARHVGICTVDKHGEVRYPPGLDKDAPVVLLDDVFSTGASLYRTIAGCISVGFYNFHTAVVVVNRDVRAAAIFSKVVPLRHLFLAEDLVGESRH